MRIKSGLLAILVVIAPLMGVSCSDQSSEKTTTTLATLDPPLPANVNEVPYTIEMLAGMGDIQIAVLDIKNNDVDSDVKNDRVVELTVLIRNGSLSDMEVKAESFRLYTSDLKSVTPADNPFDHALKSDERLTVTMKFPVKANLLGVGFVFNSKGYGDLVQSGQFIIDPDYKKLVDSGSTAGN